MKTLHREFIVKPIVGLVLLFGFSLSVNAAAAYFCNDPTHDHSFDSGDIPVHSDFVPSGTKWGSPTFGTGATITYSYMPSGTSCATPPEPAGCTITDISSAGLGAVAGGVVKSIIRAAFDAWEAVANLTFVEVADDGAAFNAPTASGDIRIGGHVFDGPSGVLAHAYFPPPNGTTAAGDMHFDIAEAWKNGFGGTGIDIFQVAAHEIGHSIGLRHTAVAGSLMNPFYTEAFSGPQADDIAGAVHIYGEPVEPPSVPEPTAGLLLLLGLVGLAGMQRKRAA